MTPSLEDAFDPSTRDRLRRALRSAARDIVAAGARPIEQARAALAASDWGGLAHLMHSLRGAAGSLDAGQFASAAREVESALKAHDFTSVAARLDSAAGHYLALLESTARWLEEEAEEAHTAEAAGSPSQLNAQALHYLVQLLESQSFSALDEFGRLRATLATHDEAMATLVEQQLDRLDFQAAAAQLRQLGARLGIPLS